MKPIESTPLVRAAETLAALEADKKMSNEMPRDMIVSPEATKTAEENAMQKTDELIATLKKFQKKSGIPQEKIAHAIGVNLGTVNRWFNGRTHKLHGATRRVVEMYLDAQKKNGARA